MRRTGSCCSTTDSPVTNTTRQVSQMTRYNATCPTAGRYRKSLAAPAKLENPAKVFPALVKA